MMLHLLLALVPAAEPNRLAADLRPPVHVCIGGRPLDVERIGHAAPFAGDFDGDGVADLLVGQFHDGALRIYPGKRSSGAREFKDYNWFQAGGHPGQVPSG
jgi:hypothetical protein